MYLFNQRLQNFQQVKNDTTCVIFFSFVRPWEGIDQQDKMLHMSICSCLFGVATIIDKGWVFSKAPIVNISVSKIFDHAKVAVRIFQLSCGDTCKK